MTEFIEKIQNGEIRANTVTAGAAHIAMATVGGDTIEAEYFVFDHSGWWRTKEPKTIKDKLENVLDTLVHPFRKFKWWLKDAYWKVRYGFQRMFNGYDDVDTFEIFYKFVDRYSKILTEYRKHHIGYCGEMTEEEWDAIIDEMIYHLKYMDEETVIDELERDVPDEWTVSSRTVSEVLDKHKDEFFKLFSKYFFHLWD